MNTTLNTKQRFQIWAALWIIALLSDTTVITLTSKGYIPVYVAPIVIWLIHAARGTLTLYILGPVGVDAFKNLDTRWQDVVIVSVAMITALFLYGFDQKYNNTSDMTGETIETVLINEQHRLEQEKARINDVWLQEQAKVESHVREALKR